MHFLWGDFAILILLALLLKKELTKPLPYFTELDCKKVVFCSDFTGTSEFL